jgi:hypothetical protein
MRKAKAPEPPKKPAAPAGPSFGVALADLRPTQMTVGFREVALKRKQWQEADLQQRVELLRSHTVPAVIGPKGKHYIIDHHHFALALSEEGAPEVAVYVMADLQKLPKSEFWTFLDNSAWCHAYDVDGNRRELSAIPKKLSDLADDPYRSLVGALYRAGGLAKSHAPFYEFLWADFLRRRVPLQMVATDPDGALKTALKLAKSKDAKSLPGWCGRRGVGDD